MLWDADVNSETFGEVLKRCHSVITGLVQACHFLLMERNLL